MLSQLCVNALVAGSIYALVGVSFSLIYQVQRFFHFTHGLSCAVGAYVAYGLCQLGLSTPLAILASVCVAGALGALLDLGMITPIKNRGGSALVLLLASIGAYIVGQNLLSICFGDDLKILTSGKISAGINVLGARITLLQIAILGLAFGALAAIALSLALTNAGRNTRALANDEGLATIVGLATRRTRQAVMVIGSGIAGFAGVLFALDQAIVPTMGMKLLLIGVVAMIVGGRTSILGAAAGAIIISTAQNICSIWFPLAWQDATVFVILLLFLLFRPRGLWGLPLRQATV